MRARIWLALFTLAASVGADAHSASDAYLTLTLDDSQPATARVLHGQWDIALRDLDFALQLDDGDGRLTWGEVRRHQPAIVRYALAHLQFDAAGGQPCAIGAVRQLIDEHADGAYASLSFDVRCSGAPAKLALSYDLFFAIDPSHRGIFVMRSGADAATAVLSPQNARIELTL